MHAIKTFCHGGAENTEINEMILSVFSVPPWQISAPIAGAAPDAVRLFTASAG